VSSDLRRETTLYALAAVVNGLAMAAFLPFMSSTLSPEQAGEAGVLRTLADVIAGIAVLGLPAGIVRAWQDDGMDRRRLLWTSMLLPLVPSVILAAAVLVPSGPVAAALRLPGTGNLVHAVLLGVAAAWVQVALAFHRASGRAVSFFAVQAARGAVSIGLLALLLGAGRRDVSSFMAARWIPALAATAAAFVMTLPAAARGGSRPAGLLAFSLPLAPAGLALIVLSSADMFMLRKLAPDLAQSGYYEWAMTACMVFAPFTLGFGMAWQRHIFRLRSEGGSLAPLGRTAMIYMAVLLWFAAAFALAAPEITALIGGEDYAGAAGVIPLLSGAGALYGLYIISQTGPMLSGSTGWIAFVTLVGAGANIWFNWRLIPLYGAEGAALATLGTNMFMSACLFWVGRRHFPVSIPLVLLMAAVPLSLGPLAGLPLPVRAGVAVVSGLLVSSLVRALRRAGAPEAGNV
jgi:O-antigen/teichoic acid export membrane protein